MCWHVQVRLLIPRLCIKHWQGQFCTARSSQGTFAEDNLQYHPENMLPRHMLNE